MNLAFTVQLKQVKEERNESLLSVSHILRLNLNLSACLFLFPLVNPSVESFVELHYQEQIVPLQSKQRYPELQKLLIHCCEEEVHHKEDARDRWVTDVNAPRPWYANVWSWIVGSGSAGAVSVCKRI